jgi:hypothetical protein
MTDPGDVIVAATIAELDKYPLADVAKEEIDVILDEIPEIDLPLKAVRALMLLAWLRGASWRAHDRQ